MSRKNISELHQVVLSIYIPHLSLRVNDRKTLFATAKVGQLIVSKSVQLKQIDEDQYKTSLPLKLDLVVPHDKETGDYQNKQIKLIITNGNKKSVVGRTTINLGDHINFRSKIELAKEHHYKLRDCEDHEGRVSVAIEYKQIQSKMSSASIRSPTSSLKNLNHSHQGNESSFASSENVLEESIVLQKSVLFQRQSSKQNISPASPNFKCKFPNINSNLPSPSPPHSFLSADEKSIIENLSIITNQCNILRSMMIENPSFAALQEENVHLNEAKQHMKNQIQSLQYLNGVLLEEQSNKEREIEYLQKELDKAYNVINKFKGSMELGTIQELKDEVNWLRQAKEVADQQFNKLKQENDELVEENRIMKQRWQREQQMPKNQQQQKVKIINSLKFKDVMKLSLQFNWLKRNLLKHSLNHEETFRLIHPLQSVIQGFQPQFLN